MNIRIEFKDAKGMQRSDTDYQHGMTKILNNKCPEDLKTEIISGNAYFLDTRDENDQCSIKPVATDPSLQ